MKFQNWWAILTKHPKERECDSERESGGSDVSAMHVFNAQLAPEKLCRRQCCNIHPTSTCLLAIKFLCVNCYCTLLPIIHMSLNAPFLLRRVCHSVLDSFWISPLLGCTTTIWTKAPIQPCSGFGGLSAIVHPNKFPFIDCSAGVVILREVVLSIWNKRIYFHEAYGSFELCVEPEGLC